MSNFQNCETTILRRFELPWLQKKLTVNKNVDLDGTLNSIEVEYVAHIKANIYSSTKKSPYEKRMTTKSYYEWTLKLFVIITVVMILQNRSGML